MKRRHLYLVLFAVPAVLASFMAAGLLVAATAGVLWLFFFGDNPWPPIANTLLAVQLYASCAGLAWLLLRQAYRAGLRQETAPALHRGHLAFAVVTTLLFGGALVARLAGG